MKRSDAALLLPGLALLLAALAYIGAFVWNSLSPPLRTAQAERTVWRDCTELTGVVIRAEQTIAPGRAHIRFTAAEGQRVAAGEPLGIAYDSGLEYFRASLLLRLRRELAIWETGAGPVGEAGVRRSTAALTRALAKRDFSALAGAEAQTRLALLHHRAEDAALLRAEILSLENAGAEECLLTAPASGFFSRRTDGWETLNLANARNLTSDAILTLTAAAPNPTAAPGRLVTGSTWLFAALIPQDAAGRFAPGDTVTLLLGGEGLEAEVRFLCPGDGGETGVVFACRTDLDRVLSLRAVRAEAEFSRQEGFLLPEEAVHDPEGDAFVYRLAGELVQRETVTVLARLEEGVLVESPGLREGSPVILGEDDYTNGVLPG